MYEKSAEIYRVHGDMQKALEYMNLAALYAKDLENDPALILLTLSLAPLADQAGIHPWALVFVILLTTDPFFFPYQSANLSYGFTVWGRRLLITGKVAMLPFAMVLLFC